MAAEPPLYVTRPWLPPLADLVPSLEEIWRTRQLTNFGPFHRRFEAALCAYLGVAHVTLVGNATLGLMLALRHLGISGDVITTPFTFVATATALTWSGLRPVFADIDPHTLNLDPACIEAAITPQTTAILPVHCYGRPCDVEGIQAVADRHGLRVIYDAAHAFGVQRHGASLLSAGDLAVVSFHATKVFNTFEGGAIVAPDANAKRRIEQLGDFGIVDEETIDEAGINTKMCEFNAALGLQQLLSVDEAIRRRRAVDTRYRSALRSVRGLRCVGEATEDDPGRLHNYAYFPILVEADYPLSRDGLHALLRSHGIHARKYFHPLVSSLPMYRGLPSASATTLPVATRVAAQVLCLPIHPELTPAQQDRVVDVLRNRGTMKPGAA